MGLLIDFLLENFIYVIFISIILVFALIGYITDKTKTNKLKKELTNEDNAEDNKDIPLANIDKAVKLGDTVNKMSSLDVENVNKDDAAIPALKVDTFKENSDE